ncbi:toll-like receptor 21 [Nerophis ophidion]|uniref:toll-like receptor 21 n=1 Tax=Nerophis ophidion TaxID=159077 RepID=UPI002ADF1927|nr:toll-like receptor 21 [Nerophis ophidion]XP_061771051.1 toll-like receptor 21 [Nerophis ophidion]XP_061771052.1 toll-like receptor 21 [Nerophis ophidion]XP_061771053.1 toll-like receptor 21 [Nerophis ophidion]XP_061771054.1 toll-like receptor 21 [Nerophis ophidion]
MACGHCQLLQLGVALIAAQMVATYTYQNCIEDQDSNKQSFKCMNRKKTNISAILYGLPESVLNLTISRNDIGKIPDKAFINFHNIQQLKLDSNHLNTIDKFAFHNLPQLQYLDLSSNNVSQLSSSLFRSLLNLTFLSLGGNKLQQLPGEIFSSLFKLDTLILRENLINNFSRIVESVSHLNKLQNLDLCFNKLTSLRHSNVSLPKSLAKLLICNNNLSTLECGPSFLKWVSLLDLSYNSKLQAMAFKEIDLSRTNYLNLRSTGVKVATLLNITEINFGHVDFTGTGLNNDSLLRELCKMLSSKLTSIKKMRLGVNDIRYLSWDTLSDCPKITESLDLSQNSLTSKNNNGLHCFGFLGKNVFLKNINYEHNLLTALNTCRTKKRFYSIENLSFRYNRILLISKNAFIHTPNITTLKLNINNVAYLDKHALDGLKRLETLRLDNNLLTDLFHSTFKDLISLQTLNLRNNRISVIFNRTFHSLGKLTILDLGGNKISNFQSSALKGLKSLSKFYLDGNNLKKIDMSLYHVFQDTLTVLDLKSNLIRFFKQTVHAPFVKFSKLQNLKLGGQRPHGLTLVPHAFFRGLGNLTSLYLSNNQISDIADDAFDDLTSLRFLTLDGCCNGNMALKPGTFKNLQKLAVFILENAGIQTFSKDVFGNLTKLNKLQLNHNGMQSFDVEALESLPNLRYLDIRNLPLSCTCSNSRLQNWTLHNPNVQVVYVYNLSCPKGEKHSFYNYDTRVCYIDLAEYLFFSTAVFAALFTAVPILYVKLYWKMKYGYYVFRSWCGEQWRRIKEEEENCAYDAFISYNSNDEEWVMEQLLPNLEGNGSSFKLCLHHRDFEPGRDIVDNIVTAVYGSRKTICVVSRNFLQSEWCSLEIQLASYRLFDEHRDVLLLIFLDTITERQMSSYHRMRKVMLKKTYLRWPGSDGINPMQAQDLFWNQLRRAMKTGSKLETEYDDVEDGGAAADNYDFRDSDTRTLIADENFYIS